MTDDPELFNRLRFEIQAQEGTGRRGEAQALGLLLDMLPQPDADQLDELLAPVCFRGEK